MNIRYYNAKVLRGSEFVNGDLWTSGGKIIAPVGRAAKEIDLQGKLIAPGYIDMQVNGAGGVDLTSSPEKVNEVSHALLKYGVTSFLATVVSSYPEEYRRILPILQKFIGKTDGAHLLGIHLEGPCFSSKQSNAHNKSMLRLCSDFATPEECYSSLEGVKVVTLAPEVSGASAWISYLSKRGIVVSAGHTQATAEQMKQGIDAGIAMATHLFNAMAPLHHRAPGVVGEVLSRPGFPYSLIADGVHIDPAVVALAYRCQPDGLILVSDAMSALGLSAGTYHLGTMQVEVDKEKAKLHNTATLAGAIAGLDQNVRNLRKYCGISASEAILAASRKPAEVLKLYPKKGGLDVGADADFVVLDDALKVLDVYVSLKEQ